MNTEESVWCKRSLTMNHVKVVNVIIYKLQTKQGTIIDISNRNVLG